MFQRKNIFMSIALVLVTLFVAQLIIVQIVELAYGITFNFWNWFIPISVLIHIITAVTLCLMHEKFYTIHDNRKLHQVNFTNILSVFRISSTPTIAFLILSLDEYQLQIAVVILIITVFLSDFLDGKIARKYNQITQIGGYIDSSSDYLILTTFIIILNHYSLISTHFFFIALCRLMLPFIGQISIYIILHKVTFHTSWIGKASIFAMMVYMIVVVCHFIAALNIDIAVAIFETIVLLGFVVPAIIAWGIYIFRVFRLKA